MHVDRCEGYYRVGGAPVAKEERHHIIFNSFFGAEYGIFYVKTKRTNGNGTKVAVIFSFAFFCVCVCVDAAIIFLVFLAIDYRKYGACFCLFVCFFCVCCVYF